MWFPGLEGCIGMARTESFSLNSLAIPAEAYRRSSACPQLDACLGLHAFHFCIIFGRGLCIVHRVPRQGIFWGQHSEHSWVSSLGSSKSCYFLVLEDLPGQQVFFQFVAE